jgi:hypothetical protein
VHNITTAVRRLPFAPAPKDMRVTDVKKGHFVFTPRPDRPVSWKVLREEVVKAGYDIEATAIAVRGTLTPEGRLQASGTGQLFTLAGPALARLRREVSPGSALTLSGAWRSGAPREAIEEIEVERWEVGR